VSLVTGVAVGLADQGGLVVLLDDVVRDRDEVRGVLDVYGAVVALDALPHPVLVRVAQRLHVVGERGVGEPHVVDPDVGGAVDRHAVELGVVVARAVPGVPLRFEITRVGDLDVRMMMLSTLRIVNQPLGR